MSRFSAEIMRSIDKEIAEEERLARTGIKPRRDSELEKPANNEDDDWNNLRREAKDQIIANQAAADEIAGVWGNDETHRKLEDKRIKNIGGKKRGPGPSA
ncbi:MAG TPA: hypothetical protein P5267_00015 [Patescibacteria group bacterium]|nr:hypothetical protein [Patescibacteria group bacterium]